jgi:hypothetical protein
MCLFPGCVHTCLILGSVVDGHNCCHLAERHRSCFYLGLLFASYLTYIEWAGICTRHALLEGLISFVGLSDWQQLLSEHNLGVPHQCTIFESAIYLH